MGSERDERATESPAREPVWERRGREIREGHLKVQADNGREFVHRLTSGFIAASGFTVALLILGQTSASPFSPSDYLFVAAFALFCLGCTWLVTRIDRTQPASRIWLGKAGWFVFSFLLMLAMPRIYPVLIELFA